ncbi:MAG TPA: 16S rRNA (uracil(1498)-N(3))-methyltransferase [Bacillota bacterium]|nr:16S rRNA (uracil(1498)-N(3))-methyltransferase [Bacillota bacterium]
MTRFFIPSNQIKDNQAILTGNDRRHLVNVLRQGVGDEITVLNGKGQEFLAKIMRIDADSVIAELLEETNRPTEPKVRLNLIQSLPKLDKFEWIIQKNTELGVSRFQPVITERSMVKIKGELQGRKEERWRKIIQEAAEQSGRKIVPELAHVKSWDETLDGLGKDLALIPWEGERERSLKDVLSELVTVPEEITIIIGPEGGFSQKEVEEAIQKGAVPVTLGPRILRTETAGLVVATAIFYQFGDLN